MKTRSRTAMKVTTVRFGPDLWQLLESEAVLAGVSASQYIREAALARAAAAAAVRGQGPYALLAGALREVARDEPDSARRSEAQSILAALARLTATEAMSDAEAVHAESKQMVRQTRERRARRRAAPPRTNR